MGIRIAKDERARRFALEALQIERDELCKRCAGMLKKLRNILYEFDFDCRVIDPEIWDAIDKTLARLDEIELALMQAES